MVIKSVDLETVCGITSKLPHHTDAEFAFVGKSNVGKSSLINGVMNRKAYARVSQQPGKTQTINYYRINDAFYLVDLPGYGYAKVSKDLKSAWKKMIDRYLNGSAALHAVFLLIDIRRTPSEEDRAMAEQIAKSSRELIVIATKLDKIKKSQVQKQIKGIREGLGLLKETRIIPYSSATKAGREDVYACLDDMLEGTGKDNV